MGVWHTKTGICLLLAEEKGEERRGEERRGEERRGEERRGEERRGEERRGEERRGEEREEEKRGGKNVVNFICRGTVEGRSIADPRRERADHRRDGEAEGPAH